MINKIICACGQEVTKNHNGADCIPWIDNDEYKTTPEHIELKIYKQDVVAKRQGEDFVLVGKFTPKQ